MATEQEHSTGGPSEPQATLRSPSNNKHNFVVLNDLLREACAQLMADYGLEGELQASTKLENGDGDGDSAIAAIDFSGRDLRGTIGLRMSNDVVRETYRVATKGDTADAVQHEDWTCELANQLVGRIKNKLRDYNVSFTVNTPRALGTMPTEELAGAMRSRFLCDTGSLSGYLDVMIASGVELVHSPQAEALPDEGEMVLF